MCNLIGHYRSRGNARLIGHQVCLSQQKYLLLQQHQSHSHYIPKLINNWAVISPYSFGTGEVFFIKQISKQPFADVLQNRLLGNQICLSKHKYLLVQQQHQSHSHIIPKLIKHNYLLVQQHQSDSQTIPKLKSTSTVIFSYSFGAGSLFHKTDCWAAICRNYSK